MNDEDRAAWEQFAASVRAHCVALPCRRCRRQPELRYEDIRAPSPPGKRLSLLCRQYCGIDTTVSIFVPRAEQDKERLLQAETELSTRWNQEYGEALCIEMPPPPWRTD